MQPEKWTWCSQGRRSGGGGTVAIPCSWQSKLDWPALCQHLPQLRHDRRGREDALRGCLRVCHVNYGDPTEPFTDCSSRSKKRTSAFHWLALPPMASLSWDVCRRHHLRCVYDCFYNILRIIVTFSKNILTSEVNKEERKYVFLVYFFSTFKCSEYMKLYRIKKENKTEQSPSFPSLKQRASICCHFPAHQGEGKWRLSWTKVVFFGCLISDLDYFGVYSVTTLETERVQLCPRMTFLFFFTDPPTS